jgi:alkylation response protein AidB-like acyl-CoA dehydrogenase
MSTANLLYTDTENALRDSVRRLFADRCPLDSVLKAYDTDTDFAAVWKTLAAELGLAGLLVPESLGGAGASTREAAVVMEEIGRAVAPVPFLSSAVLATVALLKTGETQTLRSLADGSTTGALAIPLSTPPGAFSATVRIDASSLTGRVTSVAGASVAGCARRGRWRTRRPRVAHGFTRGGRRDGDPGSGVGHDQTDCRR